MFTEVLAEHWTEQVEVVNARNLNSFSVNLQHQEPT